MTAHGDTRGDAHENGGGLVPLVLSWLVVGLPAAWGVWQVVKKSLALFAR